MVRDCIDQPPNRHPLRFLEYMFKRRDDLPQLPPVAEALDLEHVLAKQLVLTDGMLVDFICLKDMLHGTHTCEQSE